MMKGMEAVKTIIWKASLLLLLGLLLFVFYFSMSDWNAAPFFMENFTVVQRMLTTVFGILLLFFFFSLLKKIIWRLQEKTVVRAAYVLLLVFFICQLLFLFTMKVGLRYDALKIVDEAVSVLKTGAVSDTHLDGYFSRYTNNYAILFVTIELLKIFSSPFLMGEQFQNAVPLLGIINICMIDMGIFFTWKLAGKLKGQRVAFLCLIWAVCNPVFLIWTPFYYTNTVSMGLMMAVYYGIYLLFEKESSHQRIWKRGLLAFVCGILVWMGSSIRATVFITVIAATAYFFLREWKKKDGDTERKKERYVLAVKFICILAGIFVAAGCRKVEEKKYIPFDTTDTAFPAVHWIAMGAGGQGVYNIVDEYYTMGFETKEEKVQGDKELLKARMEELGILGYGRLMFDKLRLTWSDGSGGYLSELGVSQKYLPVHKYFLGGKSDFLGAYGAVYYSFCLFLIIIGTIVSLGKKKPDFFYIVRLNLLGGFLFHMLWEAGTIYSIGFMTLLPLIMTEGFEICQEAALKKLRRKIRFAVLALAGGLFVLFLVKNSVFFQKDYITNEATVNQFLYQCDENELLLEGKLYVQSFVGDKDFNRLGIQVRNQLGESNTGIYHIALLDSQKRVLAEEQICGAEISGYEFITLSFDTINGKKQDGYYHVVIEKTGGSKEDGLTFLSYNTGNYDACLQGMLEIYEGISTENFINTEKEAMKKENNENLRDLAFCVYNQKKAPYF